MFEAEATRAEELHGKLNSPHETYAVLLEEVDEAQEEWELVLTEMSLLWDSVKSNDYADFVCRCRTIELTTKALIEELTQVGAMAQRGSKLFDNPDATLTKQPTNISV